MPTGQCVDLSTLFVTLQHGGTDANAADVIAVLVSAGTGAVALASPCPGCWPRGMPITSTGIRSLGWNSVAARRMSPYASCGYCSGQGPLR
jgi:hypothetical protein